MIPVTENLLAILVYPSPSDLPIYDVTASASPDATSYSADRMLVITVIVPSEVGLMYPLIIVITSKIQNSLQTMIADGTPYLKYRPQSLKASSNIDNSTMSFSQLYFIHVHKTKMNWNMKNIDVHMDTDATDAQGVAKNSIAMTPI